jgi:hypothetical protein
MKKYLSIALALAALATAGTAPALAQSANNRTGTVTNRNSAAPNYSNQEGINYYCGDCSGDY